VNEGLTPFEMWKERLLFLAVSAVLGGYVALWVLGEAVSGKSQAPSLDKQTYVRSGELGPLPKGVEAVFASSNPADSWDESLPRIYVQPTVVEPTKESESVELQPPPASVPAPPMLLPLPGPAPEYSDGLPRWPNVPTAGTR
jgi:hypothetical protein